MQHMIMERNVLLIWHSRPSPSTRSSCTLSSAMTPHAWNSALIPSDAVCIVHQQQVSVAVQWGGTITRTEEDHPRLCLGNPVHAHPETARSIPALHVPMLQTGAFSPRHSNWRVCILRDLPFQVHPLLERQLTAFTLRTR